MREEAAESLAYSHFGFVTGPLIAALTDPDVRIRFWVAFALGTPRPNSSPAIAALEEVLADNEGLPGNWWSVGKEALASLARIDESYRVQLAIETDRVLGSANPSPDDLRWATSYSSRFRDVVYTGT